MGYPPVHPLSMDPDNAQHFNLNLPSAVYKVYQRNSFSRLMFDAL